MKLQNEVSNKIDEEIKNAKEQFGDYELVIAYLKGCLISERVENEKLKAKLDCLRDNMNDLVVRLDTKV